jgi:hypothetical protein
VLEFSRCRDACLLQKKGNHPMNGNTPTPNLLRYGFGDGFIGADTRSLFLGGTERYAEECDEIEITDKNRREVASVLRILADFIESGE